MSQIALKLEQLSLTMREGTLVKWHKQPGDPLKEGDLLYEVETDKIVVGIESPTNGVLGQVLVPAGKRVPTGTELCFIHTDAAELMPVSQPVDAQPEPARPQAPEKIRITPLARKIAKEHQVGFSDIKGSGIGGMITRADILPRIGAIQPALTSFPPVAPPVDQGYDTVPLSHLRKAIIERLEASHREIPKVTTFIDVNLSKVVACRKVIPVSYNSFILKVSAECLREFPLLNSRLGKEEIQVMKQVNLSVAIESGEGLITPVILEADQKNVIELDMAVKDLAERAGTKKLKPQDLQGGTFTVTNSGMFGSLMFIPLINYPQAAVLGVGKITKEPVVINDSIKIGYKMILCLSYDHRIVDGKYAVSFLKEVKERLEQFDAMLFLTGGASKERKAYLRQRSDAGNP